jgi:hypothetical protein
MLERKAQLYDQLQKGKGAGLSEKQRESLLIDVSANTPHTEHYNI